MGTGIGDLVVSTALGETPADLLVTGGEYVNVFTGEIYAADVAVKNGRVARVGDCSELHGSETKTVDAKTRFLLPGFIDGLVHADSSLMTPTQFANAVLPLGTTTIVTDFHEVAHVLGYKGIDFFLNEAGRTPLKVFFLQPIDNAWHALQTSGWNFSEEDIKNALTRQEFVGIYAYFPSVMARDPFFLSVMKARKGRGVIVGNARSFYYRTSKELQAYLDFGIQTDIPRTREEAMEKARLGLTIYVREGITSDPDIIDLVATKRIDSRLCIFMTGDVTPIHLLDKGHMDHVLRQAVKHGVDAVTAVQMLTTNSAKHYGIETLVGAIAPGKIADIVIVDDLSSFRVRQVIANGKIIATSLGLLETTEAPTYPDFCYNTVRVRSKLRAEELEIRPIVADQFARVNVIVMGNDYCPCRLDKAIMGTRNGIIEADIKRDILPLAVIDRFSGTGGMCKSMVHGFGLKKGAMATSASHDHQNIGVIGANYHDMAFAANELVKCGGGLVAVKDSEVLAMVPLPVAGILSPKPLSELGDEERRLDSKITELGCEIPEPALKLGYFIWGPFVTVTDKGVIDVVTCDLVPLFP